MTSVPTPVSHAFRADKPEELLRAQERAVRMILQRFVDIAQAAVKHPPDRQAKRRTGRDVIRPHYVYTIDGARGAGKTYTLLSLENAIQGLSDSWRGRAHAASDDARRWEKFFRRYLEQHSLSALMALRGPSSYSDGLAHVLRVVFPGDMEGHESLMEAIFALMMEQLDGTIRDYKDRTSPEDRNTAKNADELRHRLRTEVAQGWYFSKNFGHDSIVRDAIDYTDYIQKLEAETAKAATKIEAWRSFLDAYLEFYQVATLVIMVDDSDIRPELTNDILHSIRMFLNHKRLLTVLAGNIRAMRSALLHQAMRPLGQSMRALSSREGQTANDWRRTERKAVEDYLEKILPLAQRFFVGQASLQESPVGSSDSNKTSDFQKITGQTFADV